MKPIYPRMLYPAGDVCAEPIIVDDAGQEAAARVEGYRIAHEPVEVAEVEELQPPGDPSEQDAPPPSDPYPGDPLPESAPPLEVVEVAEVAQDCAEQGEAPATSGRGKGKAK